MKEKIAMEIQLIDINTYAGISSNAKTCASTTPARS